MKKIVASLVLLVLVVINSSAFSVSDLSSEKAEIYVKENIEFIVEIVSAMGYLGADFSVNDANDINSITWSGGWSSYAITKKPDFNTKQAMSSIYQLADTQYGWIYVLYYNNTPISQIIIGLLDGEYALLEAGGVSEALLQASEILEKEHSISREDIIFMGFPDQTCVAIDVSGVEEKCLIISESDYSQQLLPVTDYIEFYREEMTNVNTEPGLVGASMNLNNFAPTSAASENTQMASRISAQVILIILAVALIIIVITLVYNYKQRNPR
jgi:uncharacterized integral membrane protein